MKTASSFHTPFTPHSCTVDLRKHQSLCSMKTTRKGTRLPLDTVSFDIWRQLQWRRELQETQSSVWCNRKCFFTFSLLCQLLYVLYENRQLPALPSTHFMQRHLKGMKGKRQNMVTNENKKKFNVKWCDCKRDERERKPQEYYLRKTSSGTKDIYCCYYYYYL